VRRLSGGAAVADTTKLITDLRNLVGRVIWDIGGEQGDLLARAADELERLEACRRQLLCGITAVKNLIDNSDGVTGLHLNGDDAPWAELRSDGRYPWLVPLDVALEQLAESKPE